MITKSVCRAITVGLTVCAATALAVPATASPLARPTTTCDNANDCILHGGRFSGGNISIDADAIGDNDVVRWELSDGNGKVLCTGPIYHTADPAQSWTCHNLPAAGNITLRNHSVKVNKHIIGLRWSPA